MKNKLKLFVILTVLPLVFFTLKTSIVNSQTKTETAGQKFKNIKVLNEMPADQMGKVMNLMSASLGVDCNFCHLEEDFSKDDKEEKQTAREMMKMTFELNKNHFKGRPEITCNTCHNGRSHPQGVPNLNPVAVEERPKQPDTKPTADQIVAKFETALGGRDKLDKITSRHIKANRIEPNGKIEPTEAWQKNGKLLVVTNYPDAVVTEGFDGQNAWKRANKETIELKPDEVEQIKRNAQLFSGNLKAIYQKFEYRFLDKIDGKEVYVIFATTANNVRERLAFDVNTGYLVRRSVATPTILGIFVYQVDYSDYKDFGGVKMPSTVRFAVPSISWTIKTLEVKNNVPIDDSKFNGK